MNNEDWGGLIAPAAHLAPEYGGKAPDSGRRRPESLAVRTERALRPAPVVPMRRARMAAAAELVAAPLWLRHIYVYYMTCRASLLSPAEQGTLEYLQHRRRRAACSVPHKCRALPAIQLIALQDGTHHAMPRIHTRTTRTALGEFTPRLTCYSFYTEVGNAPAKRTFATRYPFFAKPHDIDIFDWRAGGPRFTHLRELAHFSYRRPGIARKIGARRKFRHRFLSTEVPFSTDLPPYRLTRQRARPGRVSRPPKLSPSLPKVSVTFASVYA
jgi:hypothetical protein